MKEYSTHYKFALCGEALDLFTIWVLIKLGIQKVTINERYELKQRKEFLQKLIKEVLQK